jgi:hypothetical protein
MKNRKTVVVAFMLVAVMLLGVGYAALTDTLTIIGNVTTDMTAAGDNFNDKIYFSAAEVLKADGTGTGNKDKDTATASGNDATYSVHSIAVKGEKAVFKFTIKNDSNVAAKVIVNSTKTSGAANPSNSNEKYFKVTYAYGNDDMIIAAAGGTMDVTVTVEAIYPITDTQTATLGIELVATTETTAQGATE